MAPLSSHDSVPTRLVMRGIRKSFGATLALDGVSLSVASGEIHAVVGENGAGKSTLMKVLSGAIRPDAGEMEIDGVPYQPRNVHDARQCGVAMIYQELSLAPHLSVYENIMLGMEATTFGFLRHRDDRSRVRAALDQLGRPGIALDLRTGTLSLADQQIVEIARAITVGCRVLVLDEPTSTLSQRDIEHLFVVLRRLKDQGHGILYISHFLEEVKRIADLYTVLRDGKAVGSGRASAASVSDIVSQMVGRTIDELYPRSARTPGDTLLDVHRLNGIDGPFAVDLTLRRGEILGIAGLVGAGRTELLRLLFGLERVRSGEIRLAVYRGPASPARRWDQGAGFLSEDRAREGLALSLTVADNITMNLKKDAGLLGFVSPRRQDAASRQWMALLGIRASGPRERVSTLSGGNQQKIALARLLHQDVDVLLLDEPTRGIDVGSKAQIYRMADSLATGDRARGRLPKALLMVSSYLPELLGICDRIAVMRRGRLGPARPAHEYTQFTLMAEATGQEPAA